MKLTKQRLKEIIREELINEGKRTRMSHRIPPGALSDDDFYQSKRARSTHAALPVGADIEDFPEPEEIDQPDLGLGTPEETLLTLMHVRKILDRFGSFDELAEAFPEISHDAAIARLVAAIKANPMYGSS